MIFLITIFPSTWQTTPAITSFLPIGSVISGLEITGRSDNQPAQRGEGQQRQNRGRQPAVRAGGFHLPLQPEPFADDVRKPAQHFAQIAAGLPLQQDSGREEANIGQGHALAEIRQRAVQRCAQILLIEQRAKLLPQRIVQSPRPPFRG